VPCEPKGQGDPVPMPMRRSASGRFYSGQRGEAIDGLIGLVVEGRLGIDEKTSEQWIGAHLDLSRTPIREGLAILGGAKVVVQKPQVGVWVRRVDEHELSTLLAYVQDIATHSARSLIGTGSDERSVRLGEISRALRDLDDAADVLCARFDGVTQDAYLEAEKRFIVRVCEIGTVPPVASEFLEKVGLELRIYHSENQLWRPEWIGQRRQEAHTLDQSLRSADSRQAIALALRRYFTLLTTQLKTPSEQLFANTATKALKLRSGQEQLDAGSKPYLPAAGEDGSSA